MRPTILTYSGHSFNLLEPETSVIDSRDIAHALSNICRFTGHVRGFYSVAQHSVFVSYLVDPVFAFEALMHDASEAYLGDVSSPLKTLLPDYKTIEKRVERAIEDHLQITPTPESRAAVKRADLIALATEKRDLMHNDGSWAVLSGVDPTLMTVRPTVPWLAEEQFMARFLDLLGARK